MYVKLNTSEQTYTLQDEEYFMQENMLVPADLHNDIVYIQGKCYSSNLTVPC